MTVAAHDDAGRVPQARLGGACGILAAALLAVFPLFAWYGFRQSGSSGIVAALVGGVLCYLAAAGALAITAVSQRYGQGVQGILGAMLVRMAIPLAAMVVLPAIGGPLMAAGAPGMVMAYYLLALLVETWLSLRFVRHVKTPQAKAV